MEENWSKRHELLTRAYKYAKRGFWDYVIPILRQAAKEPGDNTGIFRTIERIENAL